MQTDAAPKRENPYDRTDMVRREMVMLAAGLKFAAYRVRDPAESPDARGAFSPLQFHLTWTEASPVICAMLDEGCIPDLQEFMGAIPFLASGDSYRHTKPSAEFIAYKAETDGEVVIQVRRGTHILGVLGVNMATLMVNLATKAMHGEMLIEAAG